jgi:hypothetical protein
VGEYLGTMKGLRNLVIVGLLGYFAWNYFVPQGIGERSPLYISNGPVRIEAQPDRQGRGSFEKGLYGMGRPFYHHHPGQGPSRLEVVVSGSSCGDEARYDVTELWVLATGAGTSSTVTIQIWKIGPVSFLEIDPNTGTSLVRDATQPHALEMGLRDQTLTSVRVAGTNCAFQPGNGFITIFQKH